MECLSLLTTTIGSVAFVLKCLVETFFSLNKLGFRNAFKCPYCPEYVREEIKKFMIRKAEVKAASQMMPPLPQDIDGYDGEKEMDCEPSHINQPNKQRHKGLMDK